ncbi:MAG: type II toxin-antitoxin system Phd/YefM family antitoxin [Acetobacteraceae bacterium]
MDKVIQAAEAAQDFSRVLREVREGESFTVTADGHAVARIVPVATPDREAAKRRLLEHLKSLPTTDIGPWTREELYDC